MFQPWRLSSGNWYIHKLYRLHPVVYIAFNYLCYNCQHNKQREDIFNKDKRCQYIDSYLFNVNVTRATCFDHIIWSSSGSYERNSIN